MAVELVTVVNPVTGRKGQVAATYRPFVLGEMRVAPSMRPGTPVTDTPADLGTPPPDLPGQPLAQDQQDTPTPLDTLNQEYTP